MELVVKSTGVRRLLLFLEIVIYSIATAWVAKACVASILAEKLTVKDLQISTSLDPGNAENHLLLGRFYEYSVGEMDPDKAVEHFRRAADLNPYSPKVWLNLAAAMEFQGNTRDSEEYLRQADYLAPAISFYQWPIGNFYLLHGDTSNAFKHLRIVLSGTREYDRLLFEIAWKGSENPDAILEELIPDNLNAEFSYLNYLWLNGHFPQAKAAWKRIVEGSAQFSPWWAAGYINKLISTHKPNDAFQAWTDLIQKGLIKTSTGGTKENLITNGDFEGEMLNMGFAWRVSPVEGVYAGLDTATFRSPGHSLIVNFHGQQNLNYRQVFQFVKVSPLRDYRLRGFFKSSGITTDSGPRLEIRDAYDASALDLFTEDLTVDNPGWTSLSSDFRTGPNTELLYVVLARQPSRKLDNMIAGKVWLDDVEIVPLSK